jgi:acetolactate synthase small subunit
MKQTLIVFVQDEPGVLNRVASMIRRRNFNIVSLVAGRTEKKGITRMTLVLNEPDKTKQKQVVNNLKALIDVYDVVVLFVTARQGPAVIEVAEEQFKPARAPFAVRMHMRPMLVD